MTWAAAAVLPAVLASALAVGCGGSEKTEPSKSEVGKQRVEKKGKGPKKLEKVASTGTGTLKGRVTLEGAEPDLAAETKLVQGAMAAKADDAKVCLEAPEDQKDQQKWRIGKDKGVANVFVWLRPPEGHYFDIDLSKKTWPSEVAVDQPHCAFVPHAVVLFPSVYNPDKPDEPKSTGQKFVIKNSAPINHNTDWTAGPENPGANQIIPAGGHRDVELKPDTEPVLLKCDIHKWMNGVIRVYDHPYAAVTDKDGNYEIKNVPAGAEVSIVVWHEVGLYGNKGQAGDKVTLKDGENTHNYTVKAK
jgi:hypothetical protein